MAELAFCAEIGGEVAFIDKTQSHERDEKQRRFLQSQLCFLLP